MTARFFMNSDCESKSFLLSTKVEKLFVWGFTFRKKPTYSALFKKKGTTSAEQVVSGLWEAIRISFHVLVLLDEACLVVSELPWITLTKKLFCHLFTALWRCEGFFERKGHQEACKSLFAMPLNSLLSGFQSVTFFSFLRGIGWLKTTFWCWR